ncbi:glutamate-1-semialdehyde 2,1-aminomutase [Fervidibacter sacchari]|uniref:Glutamate-1-semialdehyde 2,1-aminomutase n=1 Tax=Candidatus Fervidibacter sacchari TaxID=1448929 RepID=A0ABT2EMM4_9BACT|nr:glutamate-1-semialdehyde 2,1-aminomutase [Candidatus Fervidibacter sacchari]MCS3918924.1 glutamate-1-semialdehyde 2,1-aminomutase [Candidatus Fervidibacter sacchari]WKU17336.1 glutamate-1-semialdehyde 2,1-aminomutase [Candidatus Fervidibacter sacchari]
MRNEKSRALFERAQALMPGGVNSPVRAFKAVGGTPFFVARGEGCYLWDVDGNKFVDFVCSWGPLILGHAHPEVVAAVKEAVERGTTYGAPTELEVVLAEKIQQAFPSMEMLRLVNSGTEATMSAIRAARGYTGRKKIVKFEGCYHGHADYLLVKAGSGAATFGIPDSAGVPEGTAQDTIVLPYNDIKAFSETMDAMGEEIAAVIVEPIAGNMGVVLPKPEFLSALRQQTEKHGVVLIFDEVITGFRVAYGGAQALYGIKPDMTCLGKIVGGGFPLAAYGGRKEIMQTIAPLGPVYQAGTLSGNPVAVTAGLKTIEILERDNPYPEIERRTKQLTQVISEAAREAGVPVQINQIASMFTVFFTDQPVVDYASARRSDTQRYARFFHELLERGVYFPPSQFEAAFLSAAHDDEALSFAQDAIRSTMRAIA